MNCKKKTGIICFLLWLFACYVQAEPGQEIRTEKITVQSYYGDYDTSLKAPGKPAGSLGQAVEEVWSSPLKANRPYNIAVLFPHLKDPFWVAVNYGIAMEAKKYGVGMQLWNVGGYRNLVRQVQQMQHILDNKDQYDGLIIGAVQFKNPKLEAMYKKFDQASIPIISVVNDSFTPSIKGKALVSWEKLGYQGGKYLVDHSQGEKIKILMLPSPKGTGWAPDSLDGFYQALKSYDPQGRLLC